MKIILALVFATAVAMEPNTGSVRNGFEFLSDSGQVEVSILSSEAANDLFRKLAQNPEIPFRYPVDGCYARATEMARLAERQGIQFGKIFAEGSLQAKTDNPIYPTVRWGWHVAPVAYVTGLSGQKEVKVFDPSLFNRPVTVAEWKARMLVSDGDQPPPRIDITYYGTKFQNYSREHEKTKTSWNAADLRATSETMQEYKLYEDIPGGFTPGLRQQNPQEGSAPQ